MTKTKHFIVLCSVYCCFSFGLQAQEKLPLLDVLQQLENQFDVKFSYSIDDVSNVLVDIPNKSDTLKQIIENLNATTLLNFKFLNERYITVSTINKTIAICGVLVSEKTKEPLPGASVLIENSTNGVITDIEGSFTLNEVDVNKSIIISFLGFETQVFKAADLMLLNNTCKTIEMQVKSEALNQILITKFLTTGLQKRIDGSTILNTEKFGILPGLAEPDIMQSIQALPGVESINESIANINVRGGTNDQNLILWDNIKMYHSGHFFGLISAYNPYLTNQVSVTKNGTSSEFSDGVSSTINMSTKNKINEGFKGGVGANLIHADAFLEIPLSKKLAVHISGRRSFTDVFSTPTYDTYFERSFQDSELTTNSDNISESNKSSDFFFYDYTAKLLFDFNENHKFRANIIGINNNLDYTESYTNSDDETDSKTSNLKQQNLGAGANWNAKWHAKFSTEINAFYSKYNVDAVDYRIETDQKLTQANEVLETGVKLKTNFKINDNLNVLNGYQFSEIGILNETTVSAPSYDKTKKDVLLNHALFSEIEFNKHNTYLRLGVRGNYFQKFNKMIIEPRLNVRQKLNNRFALKLQGEFKNQSATQIIDFQDDFLGVENRRWILANNSSIPISESKQGSFGFEFNQNNFVIDVEGFYKLVDGITASNQGFYNNFQYINAAGSYAVKGVEFLMNKTAESYSAWVSYTYSVNDYEFESITPSVFPNNVDVRHSMSMAFNYDIRDDLKVSIGGIWRSGAPYTKPVEGNETIQNGNNTVVNYDLPNNENLDDFIRLDVSLKYNFNITNTSNGAISLGVINVTNKENSINRYYEVHPEDSNSAIQIDNKSLGLTPNLSFRINF
ncbi:TonB-dependent receptor plug domain-containing protein [Hwangdonia seohaensis]|uniref:Carboxypeptidase-like regulatory domain-containing protein n=1 Tax=Hwangdonia seohaensis TaxID=1240727 RepID=A0ABW3RFT2_9FLAO|nr:carboxypeptidase-like regulatory domain-containing protein [Hwangdonia seohaensis]